MTVDILIIAVVVFAVELINRIVAMIKIWNHGLAFATNIYCRSFVAILFC